MQQGWRKQQQQGWDGKGWFGVEIYEVGFIKWGWGVHNFFCQKQPLNTKLCYYYLQNNMSLPVINNRNPKNLQKKGNPIEIGGPGLQEFGLGIQVFKIEANQVTDADPGKQRRFMKNIENPISAQPPPIYSKRAQILPSLSCEKRQKLGILNDTMLHRRTAVQKKKISFQPEVIKQVQQKKRPIEKKTASVQYGNRNAPLEQTPAIPEEKEAVYMHYHPSYNEIQTFYSQMQERELENAKEIKKLRKAKQNNIEELQQRLRLRQNKTEMVESLLQLEKFGQFHPFEEYDEFSLEGYMQGGEKFIFHDEEIVMDY